MRLRIAWHRFMASSAHGIDAVRAWLDERAVSYERVVPVLWAPVARDGRTLVDGGTVTQVPVYGLATTRRWRPTPPA